MSHDCLGDLVWLPKVITYFLEMWLQPGELSFALPEANGILGEQIHGSGLLGSVLYLMRLPTAAWQ